MSLEIGHPENSIIIAEKFNNVTKKCELTKNSKKTMQISFLPEDEFEIEKGERLKRMRLNLKSEMFFPYIIDFTDDNKQVQQTYITGTKGCGKTTYIRNYVILFHKKYPKAKIYLFSSKTKDEMLDQLKYIERINIDDDYIENPVEIGQLNCGQKVCLCIFDDVQDFRSKKITQEIGRFRDECLRNGRERGIFVLCVYHNPCEYKETRHQLFECDKIVIFPKRCKRGIYDYLLEKKLHVDKAARRAINELNSTFVCIDTGMIPTIISDKYIILDK